MTDSVVNAGRWQPLQNGCVGRFAPSPTGPLHFGTLIAAVGSYLACKREHGLWLMRIEDIDTPRVVPGSDVAMLKLFEQLGLEWDGPVLYQSRRFERYLAVLEQLEKRGLLFDCTCTRREIMASAPHAGEEGPIYPGTCRNGVQGSRQERAQRLRVKDTDISFDDQVFGRCSQNLERQVGDFVLHRSDGIFAYQLAVVVDDLDAGVTQVVRGADLLSSTARQIYLYQCLNAVAPQYLHLPLALDPSGDKLSKRHGAEILINDSNGAQMIYRVLEFLGQQPPAELYDATSRELLAWGVANFTIGNIAQQSRVPSF